MIEGLQCSALGSKHNSAVSIKKKFVLCWSVAHILLKWVKSFYFKMDIEIVVGRTFNTFDEIDSLKEELEKKLFYCLSYAERRTVTSYNNTSVRLFIGHVTQPNT